MKRYLKRFLPENILVWFLGCCTVGLKIGVAYLSMYMLNALIDAQYEKFFKIIAIMAGGYLALYFVNYIFEKFRAKTVQKLTTSIRDEIAKKIEYSKYSSFHKENSSTYLAWLQNDVSMIESDGFVSFFYVILFATTALAGFVALFSIHWIIALASVIGAILILLLPKLFEKRIANATMNMSASAGKFISAAQDVLSGFDVLFSFNRRKIISETIHETAVDRAKKVVDLTKGYLISAIVIEAFKTVLEVGILALTGYLVFNNIVLVGAIIATGKISGELVSSISQMAAHVVKVKSVKQIFNKFETLELEDNTKSRLPAFTKQISLNNLSFAYDKDSKKVLSDLSMDFEIGKKYGVIGESGAGKTTIFKLLVGMLEDFDGSINYDDVNITELNTEKVRDMVAYIDQNVYIFNKTIRDNICLGKTFSDEQIKKCIKDAALESFIAECENGIDTMASENGSNFSGGQRQRIALARALIHGRKILLLDEGTSALDEANAKEIEKCLLENPELTVIMISHHFSDETLSKLDKVYRL